MPAPISARYSQPVPRYTSYPTAPHFHEGVDNRLYARWLAESHPDALLSLYIHIPFCNRLCWFCGCHTKQVQRYDPIADYLQALNAEIDLIARALGTRRRVGAIHFGGGSPTMIAPADLAYLHDKLVDTFDLQHDCEISVEIDPRAFDIRKLDAWHTFGMTRASIGVQDFDPRVQKAINRHQSFEDTQSLVHDLRRCGIRSINLDIVYGLPLQTHASLHRTVELALSMRPDRVALFGYAHVPWMKKHQTLIEESTLPTLEDRFSMANASAVQLTSAGYVAIGIDHYADGNDDLAQAAFRGEVRRNFQGYTTDQAEMLIGLGASSIGKLPQGYVQNVVATHDYCRRVQGGELAVVRGFALSAVDRATAWLIENLMCSFSVSTVQLIRQFGVDAEALIDKAARIAAEDRDGFVTFDGDEFTITDDGRPFTRTIASWFDDYLASGKARHSAAV